MKAFIKNNLKSVILYSCILLILGFAIFYNVRQCVLDKQENGTEIIDSQTLIEMINDREDFVLVVGQNKCDACKAFDSTLRKYTGQGNKAYYFYADNQNDPYLLTAIAAIRNKMASELPISKRTSLLTTPTTLYVEDGLFKDIYFGYANYKNDNEYQAFLDVTTGANVKRKIVLTETEFLQKLDNNDSFSVILGSTHCGACKAFEETIHKYVVEEKSIYYLYIDNVSNTTIDLIFEKLLTELPSDREFVTFEDGEMFIGTPLSLYIEGGVIKDGYSGYVDYGSTIYNIYIDIMNGEYKDSVYPMNS